MDFSNEELSKLAAACYHMANRSYRLQCEASRKADTELADYYKANGDEYYLMGRKCTMAKMGNS